MSKRTEAEVAFKKIEPALNALPPGMRPEEVVAMLLTMGRVYAPSVPALAEILVMCIRTLVANMQPGDLDALVASVTIAVIGDPDHEASPSLH